MEILNYNFYDIFIIIKIINAIITTSTAIATLLIAVIIAYSIIVSATSITVTVIVNHVIITCLQKTFMIFRNIKHIKNITRFNVIYVSRCFLELSPLKITKNKIQLPMNTTKKTAQLTLVTFSDIQLCSITI